MTSQQQQQTTIPVRTSSAIFRGASYIAHRGKDNELANAEHRTNNIIYDTHISSTWNIRTLREQGKLE